MSEEGLMLSRSLCSAKERAMGTLLTEEGNEGYHVNERTQNFKDPTLVPEEVVTVRW